jgi:hypothetical protein
VKGELYIDGHAVSWQLECDRDGALRVRLVDHWLGWGQDVTAWAWSSGCGCRSREHQWPLDRRALLELIQHLRALRRKLEEGSR